MRLAIEIVENSSTNIVVAALPVSDDMLVGERVFFRWSRSKKTANFDGFNAQGLHPWSGAIITTATESLGESSINDLTPAEFFRVLLVEGARQVVWDAKLKKYRNVETITAGAATWKAVGTPLTTDLPADSDEAGAKIRLQKEVSARMAEFPKEAESLSKWYAGGMKVEKIATGELEVIDWKTLALDGEKVETFTRTVKKRGPKKQTA